MSTVTKSSLNVSSGGAISKTSTSNQTLITTAANQYAEVYMHQLSINSNAAQSASVTIQSGGVVIFSTGSTNNSPVTLVANPASYKFIVGPSSTCAVVFRGSTALSFSLQLSYVILKNT